MSQYHFTLVCCVFGGGCQIITEQLGFSLEAGELQIIDANWHVTHINRVFFGWRVARRVTVSAYKFLPSQQQEAFLPGVPGKA